MVDPSAPVKTEQQVLQWSAEQGAARAVPDCIVEEVAVALVYNGISHAVMMLTPMDLEDFALGFSLTEGIIDRAEQIYDMQVCSHELGLEVQIELASECMQALKQRRRQLTGRTGCGLCGAESLQQAMSGIVGHAATAVSHAAQKQTAVSHAAQKQTAVSHAAPRQIAVSHAAVQASLDQLASRQPLQAQTGAVHGAAWCDPQGNIDLLREDVGRHNALDKLIGARLRQGDSTPGFALVSSRASYEMVNKAARAGIPLMVAVSAATRLAVDVAERAGITLVGFGRPGRHLVYSHPQGLKD